MPIIREYAKESLVTDTTQNKTLQRTRKNRAAEV
jgi:hypothetical protein